MVDSLVFSGQEQRHHGSSQRPSAPKKSRGKSVSAVGERTGLGLMAGGGKVSTLNPTLNLSAASVLASISRYVPRPGNKK